MSSKDLPPAFRSLEDGALLPDALSAAFPAREGWVSAVGALEQVELKLAGTGADVRRTFAGRMTLVQLNGPLAGPYGVTLAHFADGRVEVIAGMLEAARSAGVTAVCVSSLGPVARAAGTKDAAPAPAAPAPATPAGTPTKPMSGFAARVGAIPSEDEEVDAEEPERGDLVQHFAFGLCEVLSVSGDRLVLRDMSGPGRIREIRLDMLKVAGPVERDGRRLFHLDRR